MRLGAYNCRLADASVAKSAYQARYYKGRHRHRYEFNNEIPHPI